MKYRFNPCKACWKKHKDGECNINIMNYCVVDTATAFTVVSKPTTTLTVISKLDINWL